MAGTAGIQDAVIVMHSITGDATGGDAYTATRPMTLLDAWCYATAANALGTVTVSSGGVAITSAIVCAVDTVVSYTTTVDNAAYAVVAGDDITFTANGAADRGVVCALMIPPVANSTTIV